MTPKIALKAVARRWGVREDIPLQRLHTEIVSAVRSGHPTQELWGRYMDTVAPQVDFPDDGPRAAKARAARDIRKALIWIQAGEIVNGLCDLLFAETLALNEGYAYEERRIGRSIQSFGSEAEYLQAQAYFAEDCADEADAIRLYEAAIDLYVQADTDARLSPGHRQLIQKHLAECREGIQRLGA